jgi:hypothetical protein
MAKQLEEWVVERTDLGEFTIDPRTSEFKDLRSVCEPGNPWRCLIATTGSMRLGRRMSVRLDHDNHTGVIGITEGDYRFERPMTQDEIDFATKFDLGKPMRKSLTVKVNLADGSWTAKPKRGALGNRPGGPRSKLRDGNAKPHTKTIRARQLEAIKRAYADGAP